MSADVDSVNRPPATTLIGPASVAREVVFARLIATAAATDTPPSLVFVCGVLSPPSLELPPLFERVVLAKLRCDVI